MRKAEKISLALIVAAVVGVIMVLLMKGRIRGLVLLVSFVLLVLSIDPQFSRRKKTSANKETNRVGRAVVIFLFLAGAFMVFIVYPFVVGVDRSYIGIVCFFGLLLLIIVGSCFTASSWLSRRVNWITGNGQLPIDKEGKGKEKTLFGFYEAENMSFVYQPKVRMFYFYCVMYLNPARFEKEHGERKYQFEARMTQTRIPISVLFVSDCDSCLSFRTSVGLQKQDATKENVCRIRDVMRELSKENFNQHLYTRFVFGDDTLYSESFHYQLIRVVLVSADGKIEHYRHEEEDTAAEPSERLVEIFKEMRETERMDHLQAEDMIEAAEFERVWEK